VDTLFAALKDYAAIVVACLAAAVSLVNLAWSTRLTENRERRKVLWEREIARFLELEEQAGCLVEELLSYKLRDQAHRGSINGRVGYLDGATGRFLRYEAVASSIRDLHHAAGWYISRDMQHESKAEFEQARADLLSGFRKLVLACDAVSGRKQRI
jgi:hypothetical protein